MAQYPICKGTLYSRKISNCRATTRTDGRMGCGTFFLVSCDISCSPHTDSLKLSERRRKPVAEVVQHIREAAKPLGQL